MDEFVLLFVSAAKVAAAVRLVATGFSYVERIGRGQRQLRDNRVVTGKRRGCRTSACLVGAIQIKGREPLVDRTGGVYKVQGIAVDRRKPRYANRR